MIEIMTPQTLQIRVTTKAAANRIQQVQGPDGHVLYKVYVTCVPEDGKANAAVIKLLAKHFKIPPSHFEIIRGKTHRDKTLLMRTNA